METNTQNMEVDSSSLDSSSGIRKSSDSVDSPTFGNMNAANANSLKLKIKLGANSTPTGTPRHKDSSRLNDSAFSAEDEDKPLKLFFKKSDLNSSGSQVPTLQGASLPPYNLTPIPIPSFTDISLLQKAAAASSEQFLEWKDQDVLSLRDELETVKKSLKDIGTNLQYQIDSLQMWKDNPYNVLYNNYVHTGNYTGAASSPMEGTITKPRRGAPGKPQGKNKRKKMDDNWSSGAEDLNSADEFDFALSEDEIVDIDDSEMNSDTAGKGKMKGKMRRSGTGKNKATTKKKNFPPPPAPGAQTRNKSNKNSKNKKLKGERKKGDSDGEMDSDEYDNDEEMTALDMYSQGLTPQHNFWTEMDPYFTSFTQEDLAFCRPKPIDSTDPAFVIPGFGSAYEDPSSLSSNSAASDPSTFDESDRPIQVGELTQRLLAAFVEQKLVVPAEKKDDEDKENKNTHNNISSLLASSIIKTEDSNGDSCVPINMPPTYDYSHNYALSLEDRIKLELKSIGLLDEDYGTDPNKREDDEICCELRRMQQQLRDQINSNNLLRARISTAVQEGMLKEESDKKEAQANDQLEKTYMKLRKKKRRTTKADVT